MKKFKSWFWEDESTEESEISSEEGENTDEEIWEGVERKKRNRMKRERQKKRKNKIEANTSEKASKMIGLGPITQESIDFFEKQGHNFEKAKHEAAKEYLSFFLKFSEQEIEKLNIVGTQLVPKDDILYLALESTQGIKDIYSRIARCKNPDVSTRNFVPPQWYERYMFISKKCAELRNENHDMKTQIRFGKSDIEILTKHKGQDEPFKLARLETICGGETIPKFDHKLTWRRKNDNPRRFDESPARGNPPSMAQRLTHALSRTNSQEGAPKKKPRKQNESVQVDMDDSLKNDRQ